ncbi:hypothetical protein [Modestobacter lapidis]|nr:hypothetical protein [Modestobacter lapidis]
MAASTSTSAPAEHDAALSLADALQSGFAAQCAGHQRRAVRPQPAEPVETEHALAAVS